MHVPVSLETAPVNAETFRHPPNIYRSAPFWSWNDELRNDELERQARDMGERGWGGYFMHSRIGLVTEYLGEDWFDRIQRTVNVSREPGLKAYLYDEDKWPSGYAGGVVPRANPEFRSCALQCSSSPPDAATNELLAVFVKREGEWTRVLDASEAREADEKRFVSRWTEPMGNPWFNGATYVDLMNPDAVQAFIATLQPYVDLVGEEFGPERAVPGMFTDEPSYMYWNTVDSVDQNVTVPWTLRFGEEFQRRWDYDILDEAVALFEPVEHHELIRYHFWRTATELFVEAFSEPYGRWCREHGLELTGHYMLEDTLQGQIRWIGAAMPHYEHMGWPGMDHLCRNINDIMTARQVTSVANQLGKERTLSELFGCSGHNLGFEGQKWIADWHFVHGINLMNPHLTLYSMRGERKRDYPPTLSYQQPWWRYNNLFADYTARLSFALTRGERAPQVLVIHPIESAWCVFQPDYDDHARALSESFDSVSRWLLDSHYDFDYADESLLEKHGGIDEGSFRVGQAEYEIVVVPPGVSLRSSTLDILSAWMEGGGPVISVKPIPRLVDGTAADLEVGADAWDVLSETVVVEQSQEDLVGALAELIDPNVQVLTPEGFPVAPVWFHERYVEDEAGDYSIYFFANTDTTRGYQCTIVLRGSGEVEQWDARTGEATPMPVERARTHVLIDEYIDAAGSRLYVQRHDVEENVDVEEDEVEQSSHEHMHDVEPLDEIEVEGTWRIHRRDPNSVTLDMAYWRLIDEARERELPLVVDDDESDLWNGPDPLHRVLGPVRGHDGEFEIAFMLNVDTVPEGDAFLVVETPELFEITINGEAVPDEDAGFWVDGAFRKRSISGLLTEGENVVVLRGRGSDSIELESAYVIGDFGVWTDDMQEFVIERELTDTPGGDLVEQGYPFFAGTIAVEQRLELTVDAETSAKLVIDGLAATVADVWVNDENVGQIIWAPHELEIGPYLRDGRNRIRIELVNTLRNLLGPHHHRDGELLGVGPHSFADEANWTDIYQFVPFGMSDVRIVVTG